MTSGTMATSLTRRRNATEAGTVHPSTRAGLANLQLENPNNSQNNDHVVVSRVHLEWSTGKHESDGQVEIVVSVDHG